MFKKSTTFSLFVLLGVPAILSGQTVRPRYVEPAALGDHVKILGVNGLLGGLSSGVIWALRGGSFIDGFAQGVVGGSIVYTGKRIAGQTFSGSGFFGRQLAAVGSSVVANASYGRPMFEQLMVPLGPFPGRAIVTTSGGVHVRPVVDILSAGAFAYGLISNDYMLDWGWSFSSGAAVFKRTHRRVVIDDPSRFTDVASAGAVATGYLEDANAVGGAIFFMSSDLREPTRALLAHEQVHVLQFDFLTSTWGDRGDKWLLSDNGLVGFLRMNSVPLALTSMSRVFLGSETRWHSPWEVESRKLAGI